MTDFIINQTDYIHFICGLVYVLVATVCFTARRTTRSRLPWEWMGYLAVLHAGNSWMDVVSQSFANDSAMSVVRPILLIAACLCLIEFARVGTSRITDRSIGRWVYIPLLIAAGSGGLMGQHGLVTSLNTVLGAVGGLWSVVVVLVEARKQATLAGRALNNYATASVLIAVSSVLKDIAPRIMLAHKIPVGLVSVANVSIEVVATALVMWSALSLMIYTQELTEKSDPLRLIWSARHRIMCRTLAVITLIVCCGWIVANVAGTKVDNDIRRSLLTRARTTAAAIDWHKVKSLDGSPSDTRKRAFAELRQQLRSVKACNSDCRFVYLMGERKGGVVFLVDSEPTSSSDYSPPGEPYNEASTDMKGVIAHPGAIVEGPAADQWGNWVSGLVSIVDTHTGKVSGVLGMDTDAHNWAQMIAKQRLLCIAFVLLLCIITITFAYILQTTTEASAKISQSELHYRGLVEGSPNWVSLFDGEGKFLSINQMGASCTGWTSTDLLGTRFHEIWPEPMRAMVERTITRVLRGDRCSFEGECAPPNGRATCMNVVLNPIQDTDGVTRRFVGILTDVAEQKKAEQALEESRRALFTLLGNLPGMAYRCSNDEGWTMEFVSDGSVELTGYRPQELVGTRSVRYGELIHPEDRDNVWRTVQEAIDNDKGFRLNYRIVTSEGVEKWVWEQGRAIIRRSDSHIVLEGFIVDITDQKRAEEALVEGERRYRLLAENVRDVIWTTDLGLKTTFVSPSVAALTGYVPGDMTGMNARNMMTQASYTAMVRAIASARQAECETDRPPDPRSIELEFVRKDSDTVWTENELSFLRGSDGKTMGIMGVARDITRRKQTESHLRLQTSAVNAASDLIVITNVQGGIEFVNAAFEQETGYEMRDVLGQKLSLLKSGKQEEPFYSELWQTILAGYTWQGEMVNKRKDGSIYVEDMSITPIKNDTGAIEHFVAIKRNITEKKVYERKLDHLAHHDHLTGLPNRLLFSDRLTQSIAVAQRRNKLAAVMFLDLDRFKYINDTLGHNVGDSLLKQVAHRLSLTLRRADTIARMGGDEFTIILGDIDSPQDATRVAKKVLDSLTKPFLLDGRELFVTTSVGISVYPNDGVDVETLVRNADTAMYQAKEEGRNCYHIYTNELNTAAMERMTMENSLRKALEREEFVVYYQPRVDLKTGQILGAEALVRWRHPEFGLVAPVQFIPLCEETGLIVPLSEWVLRESCKQNKAWQDAGYDPISIAVNISVKQVEQRGLRATVTRALRDTGLNPIYLDLELTESTLMQDPKRTITVLGKIKDMGVQISIDDFGTGYSSLSYLKQFPVDAVKIDQSFVKHVTTDPDDAAIAGAVVAMAHSLKLRVIAEGVETLQQLEFLRELNCDEMQGYFVSRPVPADEFEHLLRQADENSFCWAEAA